MGNRGHRLHEGRERKEEGRCNLAKGRERPSREGGREEEEKQQSTFTDSSHAVCDGKGISRRLPSFLPSFLLAQWGQCPPTP